MNYVDELLKRISTRSEVGLASLGFVIGYLLDLKVPVLGLAPQTAGALGAFAAVGLLNTVHAVKDFVAGRLTPWQSAKRSRLELEGSLTEVEGIAREWGTQDRHLATLWDRTKFDSELWRKGLLDESAVRNRISTFVERYRDFRGSGEVPVVAREKIDAQRYRLGSSTE